MQVKNNYVVIPLRSISMLYYNYTMCKERRKLIRTVIIMGITVTATAIIISIWRKYRDDYTY